MRGNQQTDAVVASPCTSVCRLQGALCVGCHRNLDEIAEWPLASAERQREIVAAAHARRRVTATPLTTRLAADLR